MGKKIRFSVSPPGGDRIYHITEDDVRVLIGRLSPEECSRLRSVHFNDQSQGGSRLGYVNEGRREIALCSLPPRMSLSRFLAKGESPTIWGARRGTQWPEVAIRRFLLYDVFLHQLGHLQVVDAGAKSDRRKFAQETKAEEFAALWRGRLWTQPFDHPDPVHSRPTREEIAALEQ